MIYFLVGIAVGYYFNKNIKVFIDKVKEYFSNK